MRESKEPSWTLSIDAPGNYWFVGAFGDDAGEPQCYNVDRYHKGKLYVTNFLDDDCGWGPSVSHLAVTRPGAWKLIPPLSQDEIDLAKALIDEFEGKVKR